MFKKIFILLFISLIIISPSYSNQNIIEALNEGGKIIYIRHAYAPGNGDPKNFSLTNCLSQRNLNADGIQQSKKIGYFFSTNRIKIDKVLSSEWCRCRDTAYHAFKKYKIFKGLNSFYDERFASLKKKQINDLKILIKNWDKEKNLVLVTHYVVILEMLGITTSSGEIVISDKNFNIIGKINLNKNTQ